MVRWEWAVVRWEWAVVRWEWTVVRWEWTVVRWEWAVVSAIILKVLDGVMGLRVTEDEENEGLDLALHNERGYII